MKAPLALFDTLSEWGTLSLGLERTRAVLNALGQPHLSYPHLLVGGTNGKGTVCATIAANAGPRVGCFLSPHVYDIRERISIDGQWVPDAQWERAYQRVMTCSAPEVQQLSYFEWLLVLAVVIFQESQVNLAVFEVGLGGEHDATNVLDPLLSVVTNVGLDHQALLGDTREQIARHKLGIGRPGKPFLIPTDVANLKGVADFLNQRELTAQVFENKGVFEDNWRLAERVLCELGKEPKKLVKTILPGRREQWKKGCDVYLDGAHNQEGWQQAVRFAKEINPEVKWHVLANITQGREPDTFLKEWCGTAEEVFFFQIDHPRALSREAWPDHLRNARGVDPSELFARPVIACGSLYLLQPVVQWLETVYPER